MIQYNAKFVEEMVAELNTLFPEHQIKTTIKYDKVVLHFVTDQFYDIEFNDYYALALFLHTLIRFNRKHF
jgi:hypothetical protein